MKPRRFTKFCMIIVCAFEKYEIFLILRDIDIIAELLGAKAQERSPIP